MGRPVTPLVLDAFGGAGVSQGRLRKSARHIKYYEPEPDILLTNAVYRLMTPRNLFHLTRGTP